MRVPITSASAMSCLREQNRACATTRLRSSLMGDGLDLSLGPARGKRFLASTCRKAEGRPQGASRNTSFGLRRVSAWRRELLLQLLPAIDELLQLLLQQVPQLNCSCCCCQLQRQPFPLQLQQTLQPFQLQLQLQL